jgi:hypothetical protein
MYVGRGFSPANVPTTMNEDQIRSVIRDVLAARGIAPATAQPQRSHPSLIRLSMVVPTELGSPCVIEPSVGCNQCGYCVSLGH